MEHFRMRGQRKYFFLACASLLTLLACSSEKTLAGEYKLIFMSGREIRIARADRYVDHAPNPSVMLAGNVKSYAVKGPFITGYADTQYLDSSAEPDARTGYFLIDTKSDKIIAYGMDESQWRIEMQKIGWTGPDLRKPRAWF